jgi:hypothetical protein
MKIKQKETNRMNIVKKWMSGKPSHCDICRQPFDSADKYFYDFKTSTGPWGLGCEECFKNNNGQLGVGHGQKYSLKTLEKIGK